jgi:hypothetical protein
MSTGSLAFRLEENRDEKHWDIDPWARLLTHETLTELELIRGWCDNVVPVFSGLAPTQSTNLKSLRLLDCHLSHSRLKSYLQTPKALETLEIVVTSNRSTRQTRHLLMDECPCSDPLKKSLRSLTYLSLRPTSHLPREKLVYRFEEFTHLTHLTISASELFGCLSVLNSGMDWEHWTYHFPPNLQSLHLHLYTIDEQGRYIGVSQMVWRILRVILRHKGRYPMLRELVLCTMAEEQYFPNWLVELGKGVGVEVRMVLKGEVEEGWKRLNVGMLMS